VRREWLAGYMSKMILDDEFFSYVTYDDSKGLRFAHVVLAKYHELIYHEEYLTYKHLIDRAISRLQSYIDEGARTKKDRIDQAMRRLKAYAEGSMSYSCSSLNDHSHDELEPLANLSTPSCTPSHTASSSILPSTSASTSVIIEAQEGISVNELGNPDYACRVCYEFAPDVMFSCSHNIMCTKCAIEWQTKTPELVCLECTKPVTRTITLHPSRFRI